MNKSEFEFDRMPVEKASLLLQRALALEDGNEPFPWQKALLMRLISNETVRFLDIPTGLGKTSVMAVWLVARVFGAKLPRRLVYVVDRRAVVDQATEVAKELRLFVDADPYLKKALGLGENSLPVSTLRGQFVDNREWLESPSFPAIIVGTIDMVGSRLLFEGFGVSRKMRPYHAGLLGADAMVVLDEAHLAPPFEKLLGSIADETSVFGPSDEGLRKIVPCFKLLSLSATGRSGKGEVFGLTDGDLEDGTPARKRLDAPKRMNMIERDAKSRLPHFLAKQAFLPIKNAAGPVRIIVFCDKRKDAEEALVSFEKLAKVDGKKDGCSIKVETELFVGGRRVFEREEAAERLEALGFLAGRRSSIPCPALLFATSAGEVGVDLDADHMVCDLVAFERMIQRLGRVNRRGKGSARIVVVLEPEPDPTNKKELKKFEAKFGKHKEYAKPFSFLPANEEGVDVSPGAFLNLKRKASHDFELKTILDAATTPPPIYPALTRPLVDAWSMTSVREHTGRPDVVPWLRGWIEEEKPRTRIAWRAYMPVRYESDGKDEKKEKRYREIEAFFEAAPVHASELLETEVFRAVDWLEARAGALIRKASRTRKKKEKESDSEPTIQIGEERIVAIALEPSGGIADVFRSGELVPGGDKNEKKAKKERLAKAFAGNTVVVDRLLCGLKNGLLDKNAGDPPGTADDGDPWLSQGDEPVIRFRIRVRSAGKEEELSKERNGRWRERFRFNTRLSEEGEALEWFVVEKWRHDSTTEDDRSAGRPQLLEKHLECAEKKAVAIARSLDLPEAYAKTLALAARLHDQGKKSDRWQRAFNANRDGVYAKTLGPVNQALLDGYRHEFGSLQWAEKTAEFRELPDDLQNLALHLIVSHHGFGRPLIGTRGCDDAPPSVLEARVREIALRYARLQKRWGPWGLAWWESLLRAADQQASRENERIDTESDNKIDSLEDK